MTPRSMLLADLERRVSALEPSAGPAWVAPAAPLIALAVAACAATYAVGWLVGLRKQRPLYQR